MEPKLDIIIFQIIGFENYLLECRYALLDILWHDDDVNCIPSPK